MPNKARVNFNSETFLRHSVELGFTASALMGLLHAKLIN